MGLSLGRVQQFLFGIGSILLVSIIPVELYLYICFISLSIFWRRNGLMLYFHFSVRISTKCFASKSNLEALSLDPSSPRVRRPGQRFEHLLQGFWSCLRYQWDKDIIMAMTMMGHLTRVKWCLSREASSRRLFGGHTVDNAIARGPTFLVPQNMICVTYNSEQ